MTQLDQEDLERVLGMVVLAPLMLGCRDHKTRIALRHTATLCRIAIKANHDEEMMDYMEGFDNDLLRAIRQLAEFGKSIFGDKEVYASFLDTFADNLELENREYEMKGVA